MEGWTKGPWRISKIAETYIENCQGRGICSAGGYQQNFDQEKVLKENRCNANLIAAAPDLYEALYNAASFLSAFSTPDDEPMELALRQCYEAMAKACGEKNINIGEKNDK